MCSSDLEDGANYILALRMLNARFADSGKIVRAAIAALKVIPSPRPQDQTGLTKLYQTLRSTVVTLHRQRFIADLLSETNLNIAVQKLPGPLQSKWAMEVQKHESQGRPNLFDLDQWLSEHVRARQHLVYEEPANCSLPHRSKPPKRDPPQVLLHCTSSRTHSKKEMNPQKNQSHQPAHAVIKLTHFTDVVNLKESLYLSATRWSRDSRCASIVSNRDIKLMSARTRLIVKLLTVRDIITVCYTMNVHLSNCLARTHKLSPHGLQTASSRTWQPPTPSPPMTEWFISKLSQLKYKVKTGWQ